MTQMITLSIETNFRSLKALLRHRKPKLLEWGRSSPLMDQFNLKESAGTSCLEDTRNQAHPQSYLR